MKPLTLLTTGCLVGWMALAGAAALAQERGKPGGSGGQARPAQGGGGGGHAVPRGSAPPPGGGMPSSGGSISSGGGSVGAVRGGGGDYRLGGAYRGSSRSVAGAGASAPQAVPRGARPRGDAPAIGSAAPRGTVDGGGRPPYYPPYYPGGGYNWGHYPGYGYGGYGGYYGYWGFGLSFYYDPWLWGGWYGYPSYYGYGYPGFYGYGYPGAYGYPAAYQYYATGSVKLKVKPKDAEVYVDGAFVGNVDEFDGTFQSLRLSAEPTSGAVHRIEVRYPGFETIAFEVRLFPGQEVTYRGELRPVGAPGEPPK